MANPDEAQTSQQPEPRLIDLYHPPEEIYTRSFTGFYRNLRRTGGAFLFILYFGCCWLKWGERQAILFDLAERKFHIFGTTFWPQDFVLLSWLLLICAFGLFTITVVAGRIWCGYTCPQSVFTWVFMWVEKMIEGDRNKRIKRDGQPYNTNKAFRKLTKHLLWLLIAFATSFTFVGYFIPVRELVPNIFVLYLSPWPSFWLGFFTLATYGNAGWLREQVCLHMCPYARFQSVMFDNDTLVVAYDTGRGEVRGPRKRNIDQKAIGLGDCIDCTICVQVCPTGIDIRNGLQYQCIGCAACIDACDSVMDKMGYEKGLIRYTTAKALAGGKISLFRPRFIGYASALLVMIGLLAWTINNRVPLELEVIRDRNTLYRITPAGDIENIYVIKIVNKSQLKHQITVSVDGIDGLHAIQSHTYVINPSEVSERIIKATAPFIKGMPASRPIMFHATIADPAIPALSSESRFMMPSELR
ncbi:MAG: cytochrome c oxidase accessory protein CcoG [Candidatus Endonucleobacter bathymodioli]|uniref:Cytochrome c oxidase accessory protein CcoG n=1 Tax=Candidatus Endonucleibacter bathymodioli TaxID=539814 RepID=A0AA90SM21_9GAMM|nr:cytochrome c oxidase accessory protein CcoG [Candidatus Endonucleobacter bathymodioli]